MNDTIKSFRYRYFVLLMVCFVFVSCGAGQRLAGLQADFERLYMAKLEFKNNHKNRGAWSSLADIETALKGVSLEARAAASNRDLQMPTKIALLRLAMIAAWQGSETNEKYFDGIIDNGMNLCANPELKEPPTRDCALFLIVPTARDASLISESNAEELKKAFHDNHNLLPARLEDKAVNYFGLLNAVLEDTLTIFSGSKLPVYLSKHSELLGYYKDELLSEYVKRVLTQQKLKAVRGLKKQLQITMRPSPFVRKVGSTRLEGLNLMPFPETSKVTQRNASKYCAIEELR